MLDKLIQNIDQPKLEELLNNLRQYQKKLVSNLHNPNGDYEITVFTF